MNDPYVHPLADVQSLRIGAGTRIWQFVVVLPNAIIGSDCNVCSHCFIENDVVIGDRVTIKNGVQLWDGIHIENDVFVGPNVTFTNDRWPNNRDRSFVPLRTIVQRGVVIGAAAVLLPGIKIGTRAVIAAGSVVTKDVPPDVLVMGNPAHIVRKISHVD